MTVRTLMIAGILSLAFLAAEAEESRPNVLFIAIDDMNDFAGFMGHEAAVTPAMDALAERGVVFANAHAQAPLCAASRASVMTGLLPSSNGVYLQLDDPHITESGGGVTLDQFLPKVFEQAGYRTYGVGKILHNGAAIPIFNEYAGHKSFGPYAEERFNYDPAWFGRPPWTSTDWARFPESDEEMPDHAVAAYAMEVLRSHSGESPFFLAVGFNRPHVPWYVPSKWFDEIEACDIDLPPYCADDFEDLPEIALRMSFPEPTPTTEWAIPSGQWDDILHAYLACVAFVDHQVEKVLKVLKDSGHGKNTIIVLWSDHGYHLGEKNRFAKMSLWERSTRVPLIVSAPGFKSGTRKEAVGLVDLFPTLLELASVGREGPLDGNSLVPLMRESEAEPDRVALTFLGPDNVAVRNDRYRYIRYSDGSEELYDHSSDPNEWNNLAEEPSYRELMDTMGRAIPRKPVKMSPWNDLAWNEYWRGRMEQKAQN